MTERCHFWEKYFLEENLTLPNLTQPNLTRPKKLKLTLMERYCGPDYVQLIILSTNEMKFDWSKLELKNFIGQN
jgi:hypothetical protein